MQEEHGRRIGGSGFAVEDIDAIDLDGAVVDDRIAACSDTQAAEVGAGQRGRRD